LKTTPTPHSIIPGNACFAYFNKIWGIPAVMGRRLLARFIAASKTSLSRSPLPRNESSVKMTVGSRDRGAKELRTNTGVCSKVRSLNSGGKFRCPLC